MILRPPYIKSKGFCPNPVVKFGVPREADSIRNKKVIGTKVWHEYWSQQLEYCIHGYNTGKIFLPGRFYYYMNFNSMATVNGIITPDFCDLHLELAYLIEHAKATGQNVIAAKGRRKGISEFTHKAVIDYGYRFNHGYQAGIAAGQDLYIQDFMKKWRAADALIVPEFRTKTLLDNDKNVIAGYSYKDESGNDIDGGTKSTIYARTMFNNPNLFKGLFLNDVIAEECGEFEKLKEFLASTRDCLMDGSRQVGTFFVYGTGGRMDKGSKDFAEIWHESEKYNMIKFLIDARRFHRPNYGGSTLNGKDESEIPNLLKKYKPYELIGVEDLQEAEDNINRESEIKKKGDKKDFLEFKQNNPLNEADIFRKTVVNHFDTDIMAAQSFKIASETKKYSKWRLDFVTKDGMIKIPFEVIRSYPSSTDDESTLFYILDDGHPIKGHSNLYASGVDSYQLDTSKNSKSLGAMCVIQRRMNTEGKTKRRPVAVICTRPPRKEQFFDMCFKLAVYYNLKNAVQIDIRTDLILHYFQERNGEQYLAYRPTKFENEKSEQAHKYGFSLNKYSKPLMVSLMQSAILDECDEIWFNDIKEGSDLINQLENYDEVEIGSDNDLADAYGIALVQDVSMELAPVNEEKRMEKNPFDLGNWVRDADGNLIEIGNRPSLKDVEQDHERFGL